MVIIDFLIYYLTYWFEKNKKKLVWSTPLERAIYAVVLGIAGICAAIVIIIQNVLQQGEIHIPKLIIGLGAIGINFVLRYVYVKQGRYEKIVTKGFNLSKKAGVIISMAMILFCISGWLICYMLYEMIIKHFG